MNLTSASEITNTMGPGSLVVDYFLSVFFHKNYMVLVRVYNQQVQGPFGFNALCLASRVPGNLYCLGKLPGHTHFVGVDFGRKAFA